MNEEAAYQGQRSVTTHAVAADTHPLPVELGELREQCGWQLVADVAVHVVALAPGRLGGVDVEAGARAKVPRIVFAVNTQAA